MPVEPPSLSVGHARLASMLDRTLDAATARHGGTVSVWYGDVSGQAAYRHRPAEQHYAASTMKLPLLVAAYRRAQRGEVDLDAEVPVHNRFASTADGSSFSLDQDDDQDDETWALVGGRCTLRRLARHAIVRSG